MAEAYKLIIEQPFYEFERIIDEKNKDAEQALFIRGPYLMAEERNRNKRIYSLDEMVADVGRYTEEMIKTSRSIGELNHPATAEVNPERACHKIVELKQEGNYFIGKSKILSTPLGQLTKTLMNDGVRLGISSRALGKISESSNGNRVSNFHLICCDVVHDPSVGNAFVDGILESREFIINYDGAHERHYEAFDASLRNIPRHEANEYLKKLALDFINQLGRKK